MARQKTGMWTKKNKSDSLAAVLEGLAAWG